jgi:hypothetical protein
MTFDACRHVVPNTMQGAPPATVAEWTLEGSGNLDFYDGAWGAALSF